MKTDTILVRTEIDTSDLVRSLSSELSSEDIFEFILDLDSEACDWDFTLDLLTAIVARIYDDGGEFVELDESYHEKSRKVIKMLQGITLAPTDQKKTMAEDQ
jgi:hypothetical protein